MDSANSRIRKALDEMCLMDDALFLRSASMVTGSAPPSCSG